MKKKIIVMAIKPEYAKAIYEGKKHWEFRKAPPPVLEPMFIYESAPVGKITGMVTFVVKITSSAELVWKLATMQMWDRRDTGITKRELQEYAGGDKGQVSALKVLSCTRFDVPFELRNRPPQNWGRYEFDFGDKEVQRG